MNLENKKQVATFLLAIGLGMVAVFLSAQFIDRSIKSQAKQMAEEYQKKVQAERQAIMQEMDRREREISKRIAELIKQQQVAQKEPAEAKAEEVKTSFALRTPPGKRAVTILIDSLSAVGGLVNPGDFVDIIGHLNVPDQMDPKKTAERVISVLFQNVEVLAVGTNFMPSGNVAAYESQQKSRSLNVTLALEPEEASLLAFSQANGKLQMVLRGVNEKQTEVLQIASWDTLADYVLDRQGTELIVPKARAFISPVDGQQPGGEIKPSIQIFKAGQEL